MSISDAVAIGTTVLAIIGFIYGVRKDREAKRERAKASQREFNREQLEKFYSPVLGKLEAIRSKSMARQRFGSVFKAASDKTKEQVEKKVQFDNEALRTNILPLYEEIERLFQEHSGLLELSTRDLHQKLISFVDLWRRVHDGHASSDIIQGLYDSEEALDPQDILYENVKKCSDRIIWVLNEG